MSEKIFTLESIKKGAISKEVDTVVEEILENIQDTSTRWDKTRKFIITASFKPSESRSSAAVTFVIDKKLASREGIATTIEISKSGQKLFAREVEPAQLDMEAEFTSIDGGKSVRRKKA